MGDISFTDRLTNLFNTNGTNKVVTEFLNLSALRSTISPILETTSTLALKTTPLLLASSTDYNNASDYFISNTTNLIYNTSETNETQDFALQFTPRRNATFQIFYIITLLLFSILGINGNLGVMIVICKEPVLQIKNQISNLPIWNLALANISTMIFVCCPAAVAVAYDAMPFQFMICRIQSGISWSVFIASIFTMEIIAVERYMAMRWPNKYKERITITKLASACIASWIPGVLIGICATANEKWIYFDYWMGYCDLTWSDRFRPYTWIVFFLVALVSIPLCLNVETAYLMITKSNSGIRPSPPKPPPRPRFLMTPEFDYFMRQKTFTPDLTQQQQKPTFLGQFKTAVRPNPLTEARTSVQTLQLRDELFSKVEEQASRIAAGLPEAELEDSAGPQTTGNERDDSRVILISMMIVQLVFVIMMTPSILVRMAKIIFNYEDDLWISSLSTFSYFGTSIVNPFIYILTREDFRQAFLKLWQQMINSCHCGGTIGQAFY